MMPTVREVIFDSINAGLILKVSLSVSQKTTRAARLGDRFGRGNPGMRGGDDFVAGLNAERAHRDVERVRAIRAGDAVFDSERLRPCLFKGFDLRAADESRLRDDVRDGGVNFRFDAQVLSVKVNEWDFHEKMLKR